MKVIYFLFLLIVVAAVGVFAYQNNEAITIHYLDRNVSYPLAGLVGIVYVLGMVSGWTVVGLLKRSIQRVTERQPD